MTRVGPFTRLQQLGSDRRRLLARASILLTAASAAVAVLPFRVAVRFGAGRRRGRTSIPVDDCVWAVEAVARRLPWRTVCIEKGLAVQRMLRAGGNDAVLHYGARHGSTGKLEAHVWVTLNDKAVIGGEEAAGYAELARYP